MGRLLAECGAVCAASTSPVRGREATGDGDGGLVAGREAWTEALRTELQAVVADLRLSILGELRRELDTTASWREEVRSELSLGLRVVADAARGLLGFADGIGERARHEDVMGKTVEADLEELREAICELREDVGALPARLVAGSPAPSSALAVFERLHTVQARKNIAVDLNTGDVTLCRAVEFGKAVWRPEAPGSPARVELERPEAADSILRDVKEVWDIFRAKIRIQGHTQKPAPGHRAPPEQQEWLRDLARQRAERVRERLEAMGVSAEDLRVSGKVGAGDTCVSVRFDVFPDW